MIENAYLDLVNEVLLTGETREDRTGTGTISLFGKQISFDLSNGDFPLITSKKVFFKPIVGELLFFIEGSQDERRLAEITYGTRDPERTTIWTANAQAPYWKCKAAYDGDLGRVYGVQWRHWRHAEVTIDGDQSVSHGGASTTHINAKVQVTEIDQLAEIINKIKNNPTDRRMVLTAFNVGEMNQMALPPCHMFAQFYVHNDKKLDCSVYMRSVDSALGLPFNIASYALLVHMIALVTNLTPGKLTMMMGDTHIYQNHIDGVREQLKRVPFQAPKLWLNPDIMNIDDFTMDDIKLIDYQSHGPIDFKMAV
jgi:thymidylate synthase